MSVKVLDHTPPQSDRGDRALLCMFSEPESLEVEIAGQPGPAKASSLFIHRTESRAQVPGSSLDESFCLASLSAYVCVFLEASMETDSSEIVFFQVVSTHLGRKKVLPLAPGAGGKLGSAAIALTFHAMLPASQVCSESGELREVSVYSQASSSDVAPDPIHLLLGFSSVGHVELSKHLHQWRREGLTWTIADLDCPLCPAVVSDVIAKMMQCGAYEGSTLALGFVSEGSSPQVLQVLHHLQALRYVCCTDIAGRESWVLTVAGLQALKSCAKLGSPSGALSLREHIPTQDRSVYELIDMLQANDWQWRPWVPKSKRRRRDGHIPESYVPGDAKVWFSTAHVGRSYLVALLSAEAP